MCDAACTETLISGMRCIAFNVNEDESRTSRAATSTGRKKTQNIKHLSLHRALVMLGMDW